MNLLSSALRHLAKALPQTNGNQTPIRLIEEIAGKVDLLEEPMDERVAQFHRKFGHGAPVVPVLPERKTMNFRIKLIREECEELCEAIEARDLGRIAQEAVDVVYVVLGTLIVCGLRIKPFFNAVHEANMMKEPNPEGGKPLKPEGWTKPDCDALITGKRYDREPNEWPMDRTCDDELSPGAEVV